MAWLVILIYTLLVVNSSVNATQSECSDAEDVFVRRSLGRTDYGQVTLQTHQEASDIKTCWLSMAYCNRGLEWIHPTSLPRDAVTLVTKGVEMFDCNERIGTKRKQWGHRGGGYGGSGGSYGPRGSTPPRGRGRGAPFRQPKY